MTAVEARVRTRLLERREQLAGLATSRREGRLAELLRRVDSTLAAMEVGEWGMCVTCHEPMSSARLEEEEYGIGRAAAALRRAAFEPLPELLVGCRQDMEVFLAGAPRSDDLTLLALRRHGAAA